MAIIPSEIKKEVNITTPQQQKTKKMVYLLVAIVAAALLILYFGSGGSTPAEVNTPTVNVEQIDQSAKLLEELSKVSFDNLVLKDKKFEALVLHGDLPISVGAKGRENPFAPF